MSRGYLSALKTRRLGEDYLASHGANVASEGLRTLLHIRETAALTQSTDGVPEEVADADADN